MRSGRPGFVLAISAWAFAAPAQSETYQWTQYVPGGLEARAITGEPSCPGATVDGVATAMHVRAAPNGAFPVTTCALAIPPDAKAVAVGGLLVGLRPAVPKRIAVLGDTGCRLKNSYVQDCNDPAQWPFGQVAAAVAAQQPDLIIHVGDYHYRETPCPVARVGCEGSPFGDTWAVWREDFFAPAAALLGQVPWVFVRGNHEECSRGGQGWSRALDPAAFDATAGCNGPDAPFVAQFRNVALAVIDVASASEPRANAEQADVFHAQYAAIAQTASGPTWILQHRPIWSVGGTVAGFAFGDNKTLAVAAHDAIPAQVQMIVSGHHHIFQVLGYVQDLPVQIVSGHGGDYLNAGRSVDPAGWSINGVTVKSGTHRTGQFGFSILDQRPDGWVITDYDPAGQAMDHCGISGRQAVCTGQ